MQMEGVRLVVNKGLSNHFQVISVTFYILPSQIESVFLILKLKADSISFARFSAQHCVCCLSGESQCATEHLRRLYLQVWCHIRWVKADGTSRGTLQ